MLSATLATLAAAVLLCGCGSTASPSASGVGNGEPTGSAGASSAVGPAAARLASVVQALGASGYTFDSTVSLGGATVTEARGRWISGASQFILTSSGRSVTYRSVPPNAWVLQGDGSWVATQGPLPGGDPLSVFASPLSVTSAALPGSSAATATAAGPSDAAALDLTATFAPAALGLTGTDPITVTIHLGADGSMAVTYATTTPAGAATSTTTIKPGTDTTPILAPGASPGASS